MRKVKLTRESTQDILKTLLKRSPESYGDFEKKVADILFEVREKGDEALFSFTEKFDKVKLSAATLRVTEEEIKEAYESMQADEYLATIESHEIIWYG